MQRSGTTWLCRALDQHPRVCISKPVRPEPRFFLDEGFSGATYEDYLGFFSARDSSTEWLVEKSTSYSEFGYLPRRIAHFLQGRTTRALFLLRDPIERAISNVKFSRNNGFVTGSVPKVLAERLEAYPRRLGSSSSGASVDPRAFLERGHYWQQVRPYLDVFGYEGVKILLSECTLGNEKAVRNVFAWMSLPVDVTLPDLGGRINRSQDHATHHDDELPRHLLQALRAYYAPGCDLLAKHLGLDLSCWRVYTD
jgi:hypothetical protein